MSFQKKVDLKNNMKKKIIFVTQALWIGGIESALVNLINHLDYEKYDVTCLIVEDYQDMVPQITNRCQILISDRTHTVSFEKEYKYKRLYGLMEKPNTSSHFRKAIWKLLCVFFKAFENRQYAKYIRNEMKNKNYDTVVIYSDRVAELSVRALRAKRFLMFYHNADIGSAYHDIYGYRKSEKIIVVSKSQCEKLKKKRKRFSQKMITIPNYIDAESVRKKADLDKEKVLFKEEGYHIVSCGRLAKQKGFDIAIQACSEIVKFDHFNIQWYVFGVGPEREELKKLISYFNMENHFHLLGAKKNPFPYMKAADLYVQPSRTEGYSLSVLEARVLACPIVATYAAGQEQIVQGVTGTLCETNAESIREAISMHLQDKLLSETYQLNLNKYNFNKFNEKIIKNIEDIL